MRKMCFKEWRVYKKIKQNFLPKIGNVSHYITKFTLSIECPSYIEFNFPMLWDQSLTLANEL